MTTFKTVADLKREIQAKRFSLKGHPSIETLEEMSGAVIVQDILENDHMLKVFENGLVIYCSHNHRTAFRLHKVADCYTAFGDDITIAEEIPWNIHLMLWGEDRIFKNKSDLEQRNCTSVEDLSDDIDEVEFEDKKASAFYMNDPDEDEEAPVKEIYSMFTDKQADVCRLYFEGGLTQEQVAERLNMSREAVKNAVFKIRKKVAEYERNKKFD